MELTLQKQFSFFDVKKEPREGQPDKRLSSVDQIDPIQEKEHQHTQESSEKIQENLFQKYIELSAPVRMHTLLPVNLFHSPYQYNKMIIKHKKWINSEKMNKNPNVVKSLEYINEMYFDKEREKFQRLRLKQKQRAQQKIKKEEQKKIKCNKIHKNGNCCDQSCSDMTASQCKQNNNEKHKKIQKTKKKPKIRSKVKKIKSLKQIKYIPIHNMNRHYVSPNKNNFTVYSYGKQKDTKNYFLGSDTEQMKKKAVMRKKSVQKSKNLSKSLKIINNVINVKNQIDQSNMMPLGISNARPFNYQYSMSFGERSAIPQYYQSNICPSAVQSSIKPVYEYQNANSTCFQPNIIYGSYQSSALPPVLQSKAINQVANQPNVMPPNSQSNLKSAAYQSNAKSAITYQSYAKPTSELNKKPKKIQYLPKSTTQDPKNTKNIGSKKKIKMSLPPMTSQKCNLIKQLCKSAKQLSIPTKQPKATSKKNITLASQSVQKCNPQLAQKLNTNYPSSSKHANIDKYITKTLIQNIQQRRKYELNRLQRRKKIQRLMILNEEIRWENKQKQKIDYQPQDLDQNEQKDYMRRLNGQRAQETISRQKSQKRLRRAKIEKKLRQLNEQRLHIIFACPQRTFSPSPQLIQSAFTNIL